MKSLTWETITINKNILLKAMILPMHNVYHYLIVKNIIFFWGIE